MGKATTSGLPQVCNLWIGVGKDKLCAKHLAPKILIIMAVNYCRHQLAWGGRHLPTIKRNVQPASWSSQASLYDEMEGESDMNSTGECDMNSTGECDMHSTGRCR